MVLYFAMFSGSYLIVITDRECVGSYLGHPIYKATSLKIFPCDQSVTNSNAEQVSLLLLYCFIGSKGSKRFEYLFDIMTLAEKGGD